MDRYQNRDDYYGSESERREGRHGYRRRDFRDEEGYGRAAMGGRDYSTSGRYFHDDEDRRENMRHFEDFGGSRYSDRERDYNMGGYGGGRRQDEFYMRGAYTGRGEEGGSYGYGPSDDYERTGYGQQDNGGSRGRMNTGWSDRDFDSGRYNWNRGGQRGGWAQDDEWAVDPAFIGRGFPREATGPHTGRGPKGYVRSDDQIKQDVCERLTQHGHIDASDIEIRVEGNEVTLTGTVDSRKAKRMAERVVDSVSGVRDVHNQLRVNRSMHSRDAAEQRPKEQQENGHHTPGRGSPKKSAQP
jgi:hypothetical protein